MLQKSVSFLGKKINYYSFGSGEKKLVLLHGFLESSSMWFDYAKRWEKEYHVICIDIPGHGKSEVVSDIHTTNLMADVTDAVLKSESIKSASLIGHSMGGYIALAYGERYLEKTKGVILLNSTAYADSEIKKADRERAIKVMQKNPVIFINESIPNLFADHNRDKYADDIKRIIQEALEISIEGASSALRGMKVREEKTHLISKNLFPIHFVAGAKDNVIPIDKIKELTLLNPSVNLVVFPESGHMSFIEEKESCFLAINEILSQI